MLYSLERNYRGQIGGHDRPYADLLDKLFPDTLHFVSSDWVNGGPRYIPFFDSNNKDRNF